MAFLKFGSLITHLLQSEISSKKERQFKKLLLTWKNNYNDNGRTKECHYTAKS